MSDDLDKLTEKLRKDQETYDRKVALAAKELDLKEKRVDIAFNDLVKGKEETENSKSIRYGKMSDDAINKLLNDNESYLEAAKHPMPFICSEFDSIVPFFKKNLILITAPSGAGKSTCVSNIVYSCMRKKNPLTGKPYRVLVLTNEEAPEDFYNRLTCFVKGWRYTNHDKFSDEQRSEFSKFIRVFTESGTVTVIGDSYGNVSGGITTSVEGVMSVFDGLIRDKEEYDVVILDYYQNVTKSREKPQCNEYEVQRMLSNEFDRIKNVFNGAIVVMAQIDPLKDDEDTTPYNIRLKGTKLIITKATFICEIRPEPKLYRSLWKVHKSRFTDAIGKEVYTGFDRGRYVNYSKKFQDSVSKMVLQNLEEEEERKNGITKEKDNNDNNDNNEGEE